MTIIKNSMMALCVFISSNTSVYAGDMGPKKAMASTGGTYLGVFGGWGKLSSLDITQKSTAFLPDILGGPLAVNSKGEASGGSAWLVGGEVGYQWPMRTLNHVEAVWTVAPSIGLEGYYLGGTTIQGHEINNGTARLIEHDFFVTLPIDTGVFLVNSKLEINHADAPKTHPYVGLGIGVGVNAITHASSIQTAPAETFNHYNSDTSDTNLSLAVQPKVGLAFSLNNTTNLFIEYRFLYLSASDYNFGSTVYAGRHVSTSNWDVEVHSKYYNFGTVGLQYDL